MLVDTQLRSIYTDKPYDLVECNGCHNIVTMPVSDEKTLEQLYSSIYLYPVHKIVSGEKKYRARGLAKIIRDAAKHSHRNILEIGCMYGCLLDELKGEFTVTGVEFGDEPVAECRARGLNVYNASISSYLKDNGEQNRFDVIVLSHVMEHLLKPGDYLQQFQKILNPNGLVIIAVPAHDSINAKLFKHYWGWWQVPVHINHFHAPSMARLAERSGFSVERVLHNGGDSLMILLNFMNLFGAGKTNGRLGFFRTVFIRAFSLLFRYWYLVGNEELIVVLRSAKEPK